MVARARTEASSSASQAKKNSISSAATFSTWEARRRVTSSGIASGRGASCDGAAFA
jgi:hypothetical protein